MIIDSIDAVNNIAAKIIKTGIEKLHFYFEDELPNNVITYKTFDNANAILKIT